MPDQAYYDGDFYQCIDDAGVNESPATHPAKWSKISIPSHWRRVLGKLTYANLLKIDGQNDKAIVVRAQAESELEDLLRYDANRELNHRPSVGVR